MKKIAGEAVARDCRVTLSLTLNLLLGVSFGSAFGALASVIWRHGSSGSEGRSVVDKTYRRGLGVVGDGKKGQMKKPWTIGSDGEEETPIWRTHGCIYTPLQFFQPHQMSGNSIQKDYANRQYIVHVNGRITNQQAGVTPPLSRSFYISAWSQRKAEPRVV